MKSESTNTRKLSVLSKLSRVALGGCAALIAGLFIAHVAWKYSGSNQWQLDSDRNGVKVYSRKTPGSTLKQFKAVTRVTTTLNRVVAAMNDNSSQNCKDWMPICAGLKSIEPWNPQGLYSITYFRLDLPFPFSPRDLVYKTQISQDPVSKAVTVYLLALPGMVPENKCCVRVTQIHNRWIWSPLKDGEVELQLFSDMDARVPYFLANKRGDDLGRLLSRVPQLLSKQQYQNEKVDYIQEPDA
jgi:hypothetical protein